MREPDPYLIEEEYHLCDVTGDKYPESEMIYDKEAGVWLLQSKAHEYLATYRIHEREIVKRELEEFNNVKI